VARAEELGLRREDLFRAQNAVDTSGLEAAISNLEAHTPGSGERERVGGRPLRLLFIGQVLERKRLDWVIEAMARGGEVSRSCELRVIGSGDHLQQVEELSETLGVSDRISWFDATYDDYQLACHLAWADAGVLPEAGGLMLNTCMAAGVAVICGLADGTERDLVLDGVTGWRLQGRGWPAVADAIERVPAGPALRTMSEHAQTKIRENASLDALVETLFAACLHACDLGSRRGARRSDEPDVMAG
jgi:glycosyltransferase involved in cell wall biosynthesis